MWLCERDLSKECEGKYKNCVDCVLDKIRTEIKQTASRYTISRERDAIGKVEWSDILIKESEVLAIIDKYKAESEE